MGCVIRIYTPASTIFCYVGVLTNSYDINILLVRLSGTIIVYNQRNLRRYVKRMTMSQIARRVLVLGLLLQNWEVQIHLAPPSMARQVENVSPPV